MMTNGKTDPQESLYQKHRRGLRIPSLHRDPGAGGAYARTREECEEKLKVLIVEMKEEIAEMQRLKAEGTLPPRESEKSQKKTKKSKKNK